jgi:hypothetical protein
MNRLDSGDSAGREARETGAGVEILKTACLSSGTPGWSEIERGALADRLSRVVLPG